MRFWFSGPRVFGVRPGVSVAPKELGLFARNPIGFVFGLIAMAACASLCAVACYAFYLDFIAS